MTDKPSGSGTTENWRPIPETHDFAAARNYLTLLVRPKEAKALAKRLEARTEIEHFCAKDILRASGLALLPTEDPELVKDLAKVRAGTKLAPVLLVRGSSLWVADGYHRVCASYHLDEDASIPCRIVSRNN